MSLFKLKDIQANPFRNVEKYPLREDKLEDLKESIEATTYWDNIVARVRPDGKPEIAFGHHRIEAMRQMFKPNHEIALIIRELSDAQMIQMMARENNESYKTNALVIMESVRATVQALAEGKVSQKDLPLDAKTNRGFIRTAPLFSISSGSTTRQGADYTALSLAKFLGMEKSEHIPQKKLIAALGALELIEQGLLTEATLRKEGDIGTERLYVLVHELQQQRDAAQRDADRKLREAEAERERLQKQQEAYEIKRAADLRRAKEAADAFELRRVKEETERKAKELERKTQEAAKQVAQVKQEHVAVKQAIKAVGQELAYDLQKGPLNANRAAVQAAGDKAAERQGRTIERKVYRKVTEAEERAIDNDIAASKARAETVAKSAITSGVISSLAAEVILAGRKLLAKTRHPDNGGSTKAMQELNAAVQWLQKLVSENK